MSKMTTWSISLFFTNLPLVGDGNTISSPRGGHGRILCKGDSLWQICRWNEFPSCLVHLGEGSFRGKYDKPLNDVHCIICFGPCATVSKCICEFQWFQFDHAVFCLCPAKLDSLSLPVKACNIRRADDIFGPGLTAIWHCWMLTCSW